MSEKTVLNANPPEISPSGRPPAHLERLDERARDYAKAVGEPEFVGFSSSRDRNVHNFGILIHNLWDEERRNLWDSSIIHGTASKPTRLRLA